jgi:hypothetical protein
MLKSSSLCLYSSNLGTFWLKIEQFWPNSHWMVLFQKCVRWFGPSTKMAPTAELSLSWSKGRTAGHIFGREPSNDYFINI